MEGRTKVRFWIDGHSLFVQNEKTKEVKIVKNQKQIAFFLDAHRLTSDEVNGVMYGYDVFGFFTEKVKPLFSFIWI